ncbi:unnamed protein product, partial [Phaeothamnion confervicola]
EVRKLPPSSPLFTGIVAPAPSSLSIPMIAARSSICAVRRARAASGGLQHGGLAGRIFLSTSGATTSRPGGLQPPRGATQAAAKPPADGALPGQEADQGAAGGGGDGGGGGGILGKLFVLTAVAGGGSFVAYAKVPAFRKAVDENSPVAAPPQLFDLYNRLGMAVERPTPKGAAPRAGELTLEEKGRKFSRRRVSLAGLQSSFLSISFSPPLFAAGLPADGKPPPPTPAPADNDAARRAEVVLTPRVAEPAAADNSAKAAAAVAHDAAMAKEAEAAAKEAAAAAKEAVKEVMAAAAKIAAAATHPAVSAPPSPPPPPSPAASSSLPSPSASSAPEDAEVDVEEVLVVAEEMPLPSLPAKSPRDAIEEEAAHLRMQQLERVADGQRVSSAALRKELELGLLKDLDELDEKGLRYRIVQLAAEMQERTKWEGFRMYESLRHAQEETSRKFIDLLARHQSEAQQKLSSALREQAERLKGELRKDYEAAAQAVMAAQKEKLEEERRLELEAQEAALREQYQQQATADVTAILTKTAEASEARAAELTELAAAVGAVADAWDSTADVERASAKVHRMTH